MCHAVRDRKVPTDLFHTYTRIAEVCNATRAVLRTATIAGGCGHARDTVPERTGASKPPRVQVTVKIYCRRMRLASSNVLKPDELFDRPRWRPQHT